MTPQLQDVRHRPGASMNTQRAKLIYKQFLLECARNSLEKEVLNFTKKAYEEVQVFFSSSVPTVSFSDLLNTMDTKVQALEVLSAFIQELSVGTSIFKSHKHESRQSLVEPGWERMAPVFKFGPVLQDMLTARSISKMVQLFRTPPPFQQLKLSLIPQPVLIQQDDGIHSSNAVITLNSSSCRKEEEQEQGIVVEEKHTSSDENLSPDVLQSPLTPSERPPLLLPYTPTIFPKTTVPESTELTELLKWRNVEDVKILHQKQTSPQLLHFLKVKANDLGTLKVRLWSEDTNTSRSPQLRSTSTEAVAHHSKPIMPDAAIDTEASKQDIKNQTEVFKVKRMESSGSLTYAYVTATTNELWDLGDIFTELGREDSEVTHVEGETREKTECEDRSSCANAAEPMHKSTHSAVSGITIPDFQIHRFGETEVVVSHIISPGNFYIQQVDYINRLQALITDWSARCSYAEQNRIPDIGTKVMGWFPKQQQWCRAEVIKICGIAEDVDKKAMTGQKSISVEVKRLDHGDATCLSLQNITDMSSELTTLPLQALQVSLANVMPVNGISWSEEAVQWFHAMVHDRTLYARLYPQGCKVTVELFLEKGRIGAMRRGASLSLRLSQNGHAKYKNGIFVKSRVGTKKSDSDWEKHLIMCYTQNKK